MDGGDEGLLRRHVPRGSDADAEVGLFLSLPARKQSSVLERLRVLDRYTALAAPTAADAAASASELGMTVRNFYRLVAKLRESGPVRGLTPGFRSRVRRSAASAGLDPVPEAALTELFAREPEVRWNQALSLVERACEAAGVVPPSHAAIRRRLLGLRAEGGLKRSAAIIFGRSLVIDHCALDLPVEASGTLRYVVVTFIVDRTTRLILGVGLANSPAISPMQSLAVAMRSTLLNIADFADLPMKIRPQFEDVHWTIPEGMEGFGDSMGPLLKWPQEYGIAATWMKKGDYRHGDVLLRLIGDRLGPYRMLPRSTIDPAIIGDTERRPLSLQEAQIAVREAVLSWNRRISNQFEGAPPSRRSRRARRARLIDLGTWLVVLFSEILEPDIVRDLLALCHSLHEQG